MLRSPAIIVITGAMAAGKSTIAELLARRLPRAAHVRGDAFRKMIVSGRADMSPPLSEAAKAQLRLRHHLAAVVADGYAAAGVTAVVQDLYLGSDLAAFLGRLRHRPVSPQTGLWLDSSALTVEDTVDTILRSLDLALVERGDDRSACDDRDERIR